MHYECFGSVVSHRHLTERGLAERLAPLR